MGALLRVLLRVLHLSACATVVGRAMDCGQTVGLSFDWSSSGGGHLFVRLGLEKIGQLLEGRRRPTYLGARLLALGPAQVAPSLLGTGARLGGGARGPLLARGPAGGRPAARRQWPLLQARRHGRGGRLDTSLAPARRGTDHAALLVGVRRPGLGLLAHRVDLARRLGLLGGRAETRVAAGRAPLLLLLLQPLRLAPVQRARRRRRGGAAGETVAPLGARLLVLGLAVVVVARRVRGRLALQVPGGLLVGVQLVRGVFGLLLSE